MKRQDNISPYKRLKTTTFGDFIKERRRSHKLPLRKVAAELDIDPSTLGKFEKNTRFPSKEVMKGLSELFKVDYQLLLVYSMSDRLVQELKNEDRNFEIIRVTERKLKRMNKKIHHDN